MRKIWISNKESIIDHKSRLKFKLTSIKREPRITSVQKFSLTSLVDLKLHFDKVKIITDWHLNEKLQIDLSMVLKRQITKNFKNDLTFKLKI